MRPLKKDFILTFEGEKRTEDVLLTTTFDLVEKCERTFGANAEYIATVTLVNPATVKRTDVGRCIQTWCQGKTKHIKNSQIAEIVAFSAHEELSKYVAAIQAVLLFSTQHIDGDSFDKIISGDYSEEPEAETEEAEKQELTEEERAAQAEVLEEKKPLA